MHLDRAAEYPSSFLLVRAIIGYVKNAFAFSLTLSIRLVHISAIREVAFHSKLTLTMFIMVTGAKSSLLPRPIFIYLYAYSSIQLPETNTLNAIVIFSKSLERNDQAVLNKTKVVFEPCRGVEFVDMQMHRTPNSIASRSGKWHFAFQFAQFNYVAWLPLEN